MKKLVVFLLLFVCFAVPLPAGGVNFRGQPGDRRPRREIAVTFDDLPATAGDITRMEEITERLLASVKRNRVPATGFVNERKLYRGGELDGRAVRLLKMWLDAGLELGNHTYSHIGIDQAPLEKYKEDVIRGEKVTRRLLEERGKTLRYFRHPQLRTGPTLEYKQGLAQFLSERGYVTAPVTIDNNDYIFAGVYTDAKRRGDRATMRRVADAYIPYMESVFEHFETLSADFLGYEVKQTLLLHANEINADYFDDLCQMMARRGYSFISLEEALKDKAYSLPDAQTDKGLSWLHRWMMARGRPVKMEPVEPEFVTQLFNARGR